MSRAVRLLQARAAGYKYQTAWRAKQRIAHRCPRCGHPAEMAITCNGCLRRQRARYRAKTVITLALL
jgi:hypothetical protein